MKYVNVPHERPLRKYSAAESAAPTAATWLALAITFKILHATENEGAKGGIPGTGFG
jgi:hypothetical protein